MTTLKWKWRRQKTCKELTKRQAKVELTRWAQTSPKSAIRVTTAGKVLISNGRHPEVHVYGPVELVRPNGRSSEFWSSTKLVAGSAFRAGVFQPQPPPPPCERSNTIDQKGVQQAFRRYHACLGRKVSNAVGRPSKPLPRMCLDKHVGSIFGKIFFYF